MSKSERCKQLKLSQVEALYFHEAITLYPSMVSVKHEATTSYPSMASDKHETIILYLSMASVKNETTTSFLSMVSVKHETIITYPSMVLCHNLSVSKWEAEALSICYCPPLGGLITILGHEAPTSENAEISFSPDGRPIPHTMAHLSMIPAQRKAT